MSPDKIEADDVRKIREALEMKPRELADALGVSLRSVQLWQRDGIRKGPTAYALRALRERCAK